MIIFKWTEALKTGVNSMDDEHKHLIQLMANLQTASENHAPPAELEKGFVELLQYTQTHFKDEEDFMQSVQYPDFNKHKQAHIELLKRLEKTHEEFKDSGGEIPEGFFKFLEFWLRTHIRAADVRYGDHARRNSR